MFDAIKFKDFAENVNFSLADKQSDSNQIINTVQAVFTTNDDDKDRGDGISETYARGALILGQDFSWGKDLVFRNGSVNFGNEFNVSHYGIPAAQVSSFNYSWSMDNDDGWNVNIQIYATLANGNRYLVGGQYLNIHGGARQGVIGLTW